MEPVVLLAILAFPVAGAQAVLSTVSLRRNMLDSRRTRLAAECFSGHPHAAFDPAHWGLSATEVRQLAARRGYREVPPPAQGVVAFQHAPVAAQRPPDASAGPGQQRARERVATELAGTGFAWASASELGVAPAGATELASRHGARVLRGYGDHADPVLLFGVHDVRSPGETLGATSRPRTSAQRNVLRTVAAWVVLVPAFGALTWYATTGAAVAGWFSLALVLVALAVLGATTLWSGPGSTTERMHRLIQEFDGRPVVHVIGRHVRFDRLVVLDVATDLGYVFSNSHNAHRSVSRWFEGWTIFVPAERPGTDRTGGPA